MVVNVLGGWFPTKKTNVQFYYPCFKLPLKLLFSTHIASIDLIVVDILLVVMLL
jgi:hypothetical protein